MTKQIAIVTNDDDWEGLYIDGVLVAQGHKIRVEDVLDQLGHICWTITCDYEWLYEQGSLPNNLTDVVVDYE